jgi:hypothetical protein
MIGARLPAIRHQALVSLLLGALALWSAYIVSGWISTQQDQMLIFAAMGLGLLIVAFMILRNWRSGFYFFLVWLLFEDLIRKYLSNNMGIYFAKDVLVALTCLSLFLSWRRGKEKLFRPPFLLFLGMFFWFGVIQVFNVYSPSILYGLLGLKLYFYYVPLMFVGYALIRNEEDLQRFFLVNLVLASVISGLGIIQAIIGPTFLNPADLDPQIRALSRLQRTAPLTGEIVNVPSSVFVSAGRYGWYLELAAILALAATGYLVLAKKRGVFITLSAMCMIILAILFSGSRGAMVIIGISALGIAAGFFWGANWRSGQIQKLSRSFALSLFLVAAAVLLAMVAIPHALNSQWAFYSETLSPTSSSSEIGFRTWDYPIQNIYDAISEPHWLVGNGIGTASLGTQYVSQLLHQPPPPIGVENGFGTLIVELGFLGPILWVLWVSALLIAVWRIVRRLKGTRFFPIGFAIWWLLFLILIPMTFGGMPSYQNYVLNAYLWLMVGVLFRLPVLLNAPATASAKLQSSLRARNLPAR